MIYFLQEEDEIIADGAVAKVNRDDNTIEFVSWERLEGVKFTYNGYEVEFDPQTNRPYISYE